MTAADVIVGMLQLLLVTPDTMPSIEFQALCCIQAQSMWNVKQSTRQKTSNSAIVLDHVVEQKQPSPYILQVQKRNATIQQAYKRLQSTAMVTKLGVTFDELTWAVDVVTSRSFAIPKHWLETLQGEMLTFVGVTHFVLEGMSHDLAAKASHAVLYYAALLCCAALR